MSMLLARINFSQYRSITRSRLQGLRYWCSRKGLVPRNTHVRYQSSGIHCWKLLARFKFQDHRQNYRDKELWKERMTRQKNIPPSQS